MPRAGQEFVYVMIPGIPRHCATSLDILYDGAVGLALGIAAGDVAIYIYMCK